MNCNKMLVVEEITILSIHSPNVRPVTKTKLKDKSRVDDRAEVILPSISKVSGIYFYIL